MPTTVRTVSRLYLAIAGLLGVVGALTIAVVALVGSNRTGDCVNDALGARNSVTLSISAAELDHARAELSYHRGQLTREALAKRTEAYRDVLNVADKARAAKPLGKC